MIETAWNTTNSYMRFYYDYVTGSWDNMGPSGYASVLITIAVVGWLLMKSNLKR